MGVSKPNEISKHLVLEAWLKVKANAGAAGLDGQSVRDFEKCRDKELYKIWNRMSSGSYFPSAVKCVEISKRSGGTRKLGIPNISDRVAQTVVKMLIEPRLENLFDEDSYGYRPNKSAHDAIEVTRQRCWKSNWVLEYDIKGLFDNLDHSLLMKAVRHHVQEKWIILYIERWIKAPMVMADGVETSRESGTPQGGVISPLLSNLFLHYAIDGWMRRTLPHISWCRYADDGLAHCKTRRQAEYVLKALSARLEECGLEIHPDKTKIVYCQDDNRPKVNGVSTKFTFLGFEFKARCALNRKKAITFRVFIPAIGKDRLKELRYKVKYKLRVLKFYHLSLQGLAKAINPVIQGWINYYGKFYPSALNVLSKYLNDCLMRWARRKFKSLLKKRGRAYKMLKEIYQSNPNLFAHWKAGLVL